MPISDTPFNIINKKKKIYRCYKKKIVKTYRHGGGLGEEQGSYCICKNFKMFESTLPVLSRFRYAAGIKCEILKFIVKLFVHTYQKSLVFRRLNHPLYIFTIQIYTHCV